MKFVYLVIQIAFLYCLFFIGNLVQASLHIMIPGSIIGMFLLFGLFHLPFFKEKWIRDSSHFLNKHLTLLFIPATVGIIQYSSLFNFHGALSAIIVLVSTIVVMACSAKISHFLTSRKELEKELLIGRELNDK